jgi:hypothetical protein
MSDFINQHRADVPMLWIDSAAYTARLLEGGSAPWLDVANFLAWQRKAQGLVRSDVLALPVAAVVAAMLEKTPGLREAMAAKPRAQFALKTLLADEALRAHLSELLAGLRACFVGAPLVLQIPSPRAWVLQSYAQAHGNSDGVVIDEDVVDAAAMYVADFLRTFSEAGVDGLLLVEASADVPQANAELEWYRPVFNVAAHYRWQLGVKLPADADTAMALKATDDIAFFVATADTCASAIGQLTPVSYWGNGIRPICSDTQFYYAEIPADANPETVLDRLTSLRQKTEMAMTGA